MNCIDCVRTGFLAVWDNAETFKLLIPLQMISVQFSPAYPSRHDSQVDEALKFPVQLHSLECVNFLKPRSYLLSIWNRNFGGFQCCTSHTSSQFSSTDHYIISHSGLGHWLYHLLQQVQNEHYQHQPELFLLSGKTEELKGVLTAPRIYSSDLNAIQTYP